MKSYMYRFVEQNQSLISHIFCLLRREGEKRLADHIGELKKQLAARDQMIQRLQKDLKGKDQVHPPHFPLVCVFFLNTFVS